METKLNTRLFWQPCQPLAPHFPGDVSTDVGLPPWASAWLRHATSYGTKPALVENRAHTFKPRRDKTCWASHSNGLSFSALRYCTHTKVTSLETQLSLQTNNFPAQKRRVNLSDDTISACTTTPPNKRKTAGGHWNLILATLRWQLRLFKESSVRHKFRTSSVADSSQSQHPSLALPMLEFCFNRAISQDLPYKGGRHLKNKATLLEFTNITQNQHVYLTY